MYFSRLHTAVHEFACRSEDAERAQLPAFKRHSEATPLESPVQLIVRRRTKSSESVNVWSAHSINSSARNRIDWGTVDGIWNAVIQEQGDSSNMGD